MHAQNLRIEKRGLCQAAHFAHIGCDHERRLREGPDGELSAILVLGLAGAVRRERASRAARGEHVHVSPAAWQAATCTLVFSAQNVLCGRLPAVVVVLAEAPHIGHAGHLCRTREEVPRHHLKYHGSAGRVHGCGKLVMGTWAHPGLMLHVAAPVELDVIYTPVCKRLGVHIVVATRARHRDGAPAARACLIARRRVQAEQEVSLVHPLDERRHTGGKARRIPGQSARRRVARIRPAVVEHNVVPSESLHAI